MVSSLSKKRCQDVNAISEKANIVIVDIEGTTTSISFVKDVLFPYVRNNLESFLKSSWNEEEFQQDLKALKEQAKKDEEEKIEGLVKIPEGNDIDIIESVVKNVVWQMDLDRKTKALKQLQGHVWRNGYESGTLKGHLYSDVVPALKSWTDNGKQIYVYSSGSVEAQKLLFKYTDLGNILQFFSGHFDTQVGSKIDAQSYIAIAETLKCKLDEVVFFTDVPKEAKAAREAGMHAVLVVREGNVPLSEEDKAEFPVVSSLQDFVFEVSAKKRKTSSNEIEEILPEKELQSNKSETCEDVEMVDVSSDSKINNKGSSENSDEVSSSVNQQNTENGAKCKTPELNGDNSTCKIGANTVTGEENKNDSSTENDFNAEKDHDLNNKTEDVLNKKTEPSKTDGLEIVRTNSQSVVLSNECNETKSEVLTEIADVSTNENTNSVKVDNSKTEGSDQSTAKQGTCGEITLNIEEEKIVSHQTENESSITGQNGVTLEDTKKSQLANQLQTGDGLPEKTEETTQIKTDITDKSEKNVPDNTEHSVEKKVAMSTAMEETETAKSEDGMLKNERLTTVMTEETSSMKTEGKQNNVESVTTKTDKITTMKTEDNTGKNVEPEEATSVKTENTNSENTPSETIEGAITEKSDEATANKTENVSTEKTEVVSNTDQLSSQTLNASASQNENKSNEMITASTPKVMDAAPEKLEAPSEKVEEAASEKVEEAASEKVGEAASEKVGEAASEKVEEAASEKVEEAASEKVEEAASEKVEEAASEKMEEAAPEKMEEAAPEKMKEAAPEKIEEAAPEKIEEAAPERIEEAAPEKIEDSAPEKMDEVAPAKMKEAAPEKIEESVPKKMEEAAADKVEEAPPKKMEEAAPEKMEEAAPEKMEEAAPEKMEEAAPEKMEEAAPEKMEEEAPEKMEEAALEKVEEAAPEKMEEEAPEKMEEEAPEKMEEEAPEKMEEAAPEKMEDTPEKTEEAAPEKTEEAAPEKTEQAAPEKMEEAAPEKMEESAPEKMEESAPEKMEEDAPEKTEEAATEKTEEAAPEKTVEAVPKKVEEASPEKVEDSSVNVEQQLCEVNGSKESKDENVPKNGSVEMRETELADKDIKIDPIVDNPTKLNNVAKEKIIESDDLKSHENLPNMCSLNGDDTKLNKSEKAAQEDSNSAAQKHENVIENEKSKSVVSNGSNVEKNEIISN